jgi:hypothetical protein
MASPLTPVLCRRGDGCLAQRNDATCQLYEPTDQEKGRGVARAQQSHAIRFNEHLTGGGPDDLQARLPDGAGRDRVEADGGLSKTWLKSKELGERGGAPGARGGWR